MSTLDNPQISSEKAQDRQIEKRGTGKDDSPNESGSSTAPTLDEIIPEGAATNSNDVPTFAGLCGSKLLYAITFVASAGFGLFGYDQGVMSGIITAPVYLRTFPLADINVVGATTASLNQATIVGSYEVGCFMGAGFALIYGDRMGRRKMMMLGSAVVFIGVIIQVTSIFGHGATEQFIVGRVVTGVGSGINTSTIPVWLGECSKPKNRGLLICIECSLIAFGTAFAYWIDYAFYYIDSSVNWRVPIALQLIFAAVLVLGVQFMPESPRWLISNGRIAEGQRVIASLENSPFDSETTILKTRVILESMENTQIQRKRDLLTNGPSQHLRRTLIGASSQIMQQIGGANAIIYYAPVIYAQNLLLSADLSLVLGGVNSTVYALASLVSFGIVDRIGRRKMFLWGSVGQAASMFIVMGCLIPVTAAASKGAVVGLFLYLIAFAITWLPLPWLYPVEISPLRIRTSANAVSTMCNWSTNFAVVQLTPVLLTAITWGTFALFGAINVCFIPFIYIFYPETAGRSLEEVDIIFALAYHEKSSYVNVARSMPRLSDAEIESEGRRLAAIGQLE